MAIPGLDSVIKQGAPDSRNGLQKLAGAATSALDVVRDPTRLASKLRGKNLPPGGELALRTLTNATVVNQSGERDWRVSLSVPNLDAFVSPMLAPLSKTGNKLVFPYTPTIIMSHTTNYNGTNPTHTNYTYYNYVNSQVDQITMVGEFVVENAEEGQYWISALHYLRSVTKMFYGDDGAGGGNPPPIVRLNGYGDYVFNNVPVVITNFTVDMQPDVDYIECAFAAGLGIEDNAFLPGALVNSLSGNLNGNATTWVPTRSSISIAVQPIYSRKTVEQFSLSDFVSGNYVVNGKGFI